MTSSGNTHQHWIGNVAHDGNDNAVEPLQSCGRAATRPEPNQLRQSAKHRVSGNCVISLALPNRTSCASTAFQSSAFSGNSALARRRNSQRRDASRQDDSSLSPGCRIRRTV
ncbi:hypothetical protein ACLKA6_008296 [Drosophila palustris]